MVPIINTNPNTLSAKKIIKEEKKEEIKNNDNTCTIKPEIKNLGVKKHNYHIKLNISDKSLANVIKEKEQLEKLYEENSKKITNNETTNTINFWLNLIKDDLKGTQEEIIKKIENNERYFKKC